MGKIGNTLKKRHGVPAWIIGGTLVSALVVANHGDSHEAGVSLHDKAAVAAPVVGSAVVGTGNFLKGLVGGANDNLPSIHIGDSSLSDATPIPDGHDTQTVQTDDTWWKILGRMGVTGDARVECVAQNDLGDAVIIEGQTVNNPC